MSVAEIWMKLRDAYARGDYWCVVKCSADLVSQLICILHPDCPQPVFDHSGKSQDELMSRLDELMSEAGLVPSVVAQSQVASIDLPKVQEIVLILIRLIKIFA